MHTRHLLVAILFITSLPMIAAAQSICDAPEPAVPIIDSAIEGQGKYAGKAYFFSGEYYVSYNWQEPNARVDNGYPLPLNAWKLSATQNKVDAAINGQGRKYGNFAYFFRKGNSQYSRYNWPSATLEPLPLSAWQFPSKYLSGFDAGLNGVGKYLGLGYFFKGSSYARYDWAKERFIDELPISAWKLPGAFGAGINAAVNGAATYSGYAYFFRDAQYVRYNWKTETVDLGPVNIAGQWKGVAEMLAVSRAMTRARTWIRPALIWLREDLVRAQSGLPSSGAIETTALATHFHLSTVAERRMYLPKLIRIFEDVERPLTFGGAPYQYASLAEVASLGFPNVPGLTAKGTFMKFTPALLNYGPKTQAAMILHEAVHFVDNSAPKDVYEHIPEYATLSAANASGNPSSFAMFAQHVFCRADKRFGAANNK
jgi:hypothetical protein